MSTAPTLVGFLWPLLLMFCLGLALWGLGQWLRRRGHGAALDKIDVRVTKAQRAAVKVLGPLGRLLTGFGRAMSRAPLFGSRRQQEMWDDLDQAARERSDRRNQQ
ncbi:hypothetical protein H8A99_43520 [Bradyrhizobium sp. Arg68]|uniref:hypothetical protein n=1 Tax=Bradyrhizobium ivorense TaxID=2511166 RepID=UPI001E3DDEA5|nr:hypothetical protein [Bradyrhizobium ivorense]MCC8943103.1 hypothetical protein [Bradyrhizobium ivorense]